MRTIRAIDSSFYEVTTSDQAVLAKIKSSFKDVRVATDPVFSIPIAKLPGSDGKQATHLAPQTTKQRLAVTGRFGDADVKSIL